MLNNINSILSLSFKDEEGKKYNTNDILMKYVNEDNVFVSFTKHNKLGINPNSKYDTPLGIYAYPIKDAYEFYKLNNNPNKDDNDFINMIPFASNQPYFTLFKYKDKSKIIDKNYNKEQLEEDYNKLKKLYPNSKILNNSFNEILDIYKNDNSVPYKDKDKYMAVIFYITYHVANKDSIKWNKIFRELGYEAFVDPGYGIIHNAEKCQAVFFSIKNIEVIGTFDNVRKDNNPSVLTNKSIVFKSLKDDTKYTLIKRYENCNIKIKNARGIINKKLYSCIIEFEANKEYSCFIENCMIKYCEFKNKGLIKNSNITYSDLKNTIVNNSYISNSILKNITLSDALTLNTSTISDCYIKGYNDPEDDVELFNSKVYNTKFNKIEILYIDKSTLNNCNINNSKIIIRTDIPKFNNVLIDNINLSTLNENNINNIANIPIYFQDGKSVPLNIFNKSRKLKIKEEFIKINYPNLSFLLN